MSYQYRTNQRSEQLLALRLDQFRRRGVWISFDEQARTYYWTNRDGRYGDCAADLFVLCDQLDEHFAAGRR